MTGPNTVTEQVNRLQQLIAEAGEVDPEIRRVK